MEFFALLASLALAASCAPAHPALGLYVGASAGIEDGSECHPFSSVPAAVSALTGSGGLVVVQPSTGVLSLGTLNIGTSVAIEGSGASFLLDFSSTIERSGTLELSQAQLTTSVGAHFVVRGALTLREVDLISVESSLAAVSGEFRLLSSFLRSCKDTLISVLSFGSSVEIADSELSSFPTAVLFQPSDFTVSPDSPARVTISNSVLQDFHSAIEINVDRTVYSGTYSRTSSLLLRDVQLSKFQEAVTGTTYFWSLSILNCGFKSGAVALLLTLNDQSLTVTSSTFSALSQALVLLYLAGSATVSSCSFTGVNQGVVVAHAATASALTVLGSSFQSIGNTTVVGAALFAREVGKVSFLASSVSDSSAQSGAGMSAYTVPLVEITNSQFRNLAAAHAAAIDLKNSNVNLLSSDFDNVVSQEHVFSVDGQSKTTYSGLSARSLSAGGSVFFCFESDTTFLNSVIADSHSDDDFLKLGVNSAPVICSDTEFLRISFRTVLMTSYAAQVFVFSNVTFSISTDSDTIFGNYGTLVNLTRSRISGEVGAVFGGVGPTGKTVISNCELSHLKTKSVFAAGNAIMEVYNSTFTDITITSAQERPLSTTPFLLFNVTVRNVVGEFLNSKQSALTITLLTVANCTVPEDSSFIDAVQSTLTLTSATFTDISLAKSAALLYIDLQSSYSVSKSVFQRVSSQDATGLLVLQQSTLLLSQVQVRDFNSSFIVASESVLAIEQSVFTNTRPSLVEFDGGVVSGVQMKSVAITASNFTRLAARNGGVVCLKYTNPNKATLQREMPASGFLLVANCTFEQCTSSLDGAAVYVSDGAATFTSVRFTSNRAGRNGGAVALYCHPSELQFLCRYTVTNSSFRHNVALSDGGAIKYDKVRPKLAYCTETNNTALYGNFLAAYPFELRFLLNATQLLGESGRAMSNPIEIGLFDSLNQLIVSDSTSVSSLKALNKSTLVSGLKAVRARAGVYSFAELSITEKPGSAVALQFTSEAIDYINPDPNTNSSILPIDFTYSLRQCVIGEIVQNSICDLCVSGTYSFDTADSVCKNCPGGLVCHGGANTSLTRDHWRPYNTSETLMDCPTKDICLGGNEPTCEKGYTGRMCTTCEDKYFRFGSFFCVECGNATFGIFRGVLVVLGAAIFYVIIILGNLRSTAKKKSALSIHLRIFINYNQVSMLMSNLQIKWPADLLTFFEGLKLTGNATQFAFSNECLSSEATLRYVYQKTAVVACIPIFVVAFALLIWSIVAIAKRKLEYLKVHFVCSVVVLLLTMQPIVLQSALQMFPCKEVEPGSLWLLHDLRVACWTGDHNIFAFGVALPAILIWSIFTPLLMWGMVYRLRHNLNNVVNLRRIGFLYSGYRSRFYYWEFIVVLRKSVMVAVAYLLVSVSNETQSEVAIGVLWLCLITHYQAYPFESKRYNRTEFFSLFASVVTVLAGALYLSDLRTQTSAYYALLTTAFLVNSFFIFLWLLLICVYLSQNATKLAFIGKWLEKCGGKHF